MGVMPNLALALKEAPPSLVPFLRDAERATERAADLVRQLMTYAGRNRPTARRTESLASLAERTLAICRTTFDRGITFDTRLDGEVSARVDAAQIEQALLNLLINARDAVGGLRSQVPRVGVDVAVVRAGSPELAGRARSPDSDYARIRVTDNGTGMDAATLARIYEPFFTTKGVGRGTGLGLATTDSIVREHGGWLTCESVPGAGATFSIYIPCEARASAGPPALEPVSGGGTETILIIDDEASIRRVVALILESAGYTAVVAASGQEAIQVLADAPMASKVALVLLDVSMPGMPGRDLRRHLSELVPHARVIYFTGYAFDATGSDHDFVLEKPVSQSKLLRTVRDVLDRGAR
jgi:two-component system cell cycle sensor histidine kinase/response regulator CckA